MAASIRQPVVSRLPERAERSAKASLAHLRNPETEIWRARIGRAVDRAMRLAGWSLKELSGHVKRDERQVARWIDGQERPQFDVLFAVAVLQQPLVIALAELAEIGVEIDTVIRLRRRA